MYFVNKVHQLIKHNHQLIKVYMQLYLFNYGYKMLNFLKNNGRFN